MSFLSKLLLASLLFSTAPSLSAESTPDDNSNRIKQELVNAQNALTSVKIEALKELLVQGDQNLIVRLDAQDVLLSQQNNRISDINMFVTGFGAIAAVLGVVAAVLALVGFYNVKSRASADAQAAAREWFDKHQNQLDNQTQAFQSKIEEQLIDFQAHIDQSSEQFSEHLAKEQENAGYQVKEVLKKLQDDAKEQHSVLLTGKEVPKKLQGDVTASKKRHNTLLTEMEKSILSDASKATRDKPENSYTFDDWNTKAFAAEQKQDYQEALVYWRKAFDVSDISDTQSANTLFNISLSLAKINDFQSSLDSYDELLGGYGQLEQPVLQEICAKALVNKGVILVNEFNNPEAALTVYDDVLNRYGEFEQPTLQEPCAQALSNKGWTLSNKFNNPEAALAVYDELLDRYGELQQSAIQVHCVVALGYKGMVLGSLEKLPAAINCFEDLLTRYAQNENPQIQQYCQSARANLVEFTLINGQPEAALNNINQLLEQSDKDNEEFAIIHFLRWIAAPETPQQTTLNVIRELPADVEYDWNWNDIRPLINQLPEPRKTQANHYIAFFEEHQDVERLERELESVTS